jgi:hypothetical protein
MLNDSSETCYAGIDLTRAGVTRTAAMLDAGRKRLCLPLIHYQAAPVPVGY